MQYIIDNTPIVEAEFVMPTQIIIDKGYIYRGITSTEGIAWHFFPHSTDGFLQQDDYYVKQFDYRISDPTKTAYMIDDVIYNYSHYVSKLGGVYFYYENNGNEVFAAQGQMGGNISLHIPVELGIPESLYYGDAQHTVYDYPMMINGKAPYGSSEDDAVWKVYYNEVDYQGTVVSTTIQENVKWSDIINN